MSYGTRMTEKHEMKLIRRKFLVVIEQMPASENAGHIALVFRSVPHDARMESMEMMENGSVEIVFVEEQAQP